VRRALVIEDQKPVRDSIGDLLKIAGCDVRLVGDGHAALSELLKTPYDLITLDLNMPSIDGVSLIEHVINEGGPNSHTPVIVISAYLSPTTIEDLKALGIRIFLEKPFEADDFLVPVRRILGIG